MREMGGGATDQALRELVIWGGGIDHERLITKRGVTSVFTVHLSAADEVLFIKVFLRMCAPAFIQPAFTNERF